MAPAPDQTQTQQLIKVLYCIPWSLQDLRIFLVNAFNAF
jgi:hypothetical protein